MKSVKIIALALAVCMALGLGSAMAAYSLDLAVTSDGVTPKSAFLPGETVYMTISASNDAGDEEIAGAAFSLQYPADVLTGPAVDADGVAVDSSIVTSFSFSITKDSVTTDTHRQNTVVSGTVGTVYFAGAGISDTGTYPPQSADPELFTAKFTVRNDAVLGPFQVTLKPTELYNPDAGYGDASDASQTPEAVTVLVGANTPGSPEEFPVLLNTFAAQDYDGLWATDGDSIDDQWEMDNFGDLDTATDTTDYDNDGYLDRYEQTSENNTNPKVQDQAWTLDNYDPATDNRGPYQVVTGDPSEPRAPAGESFAVNLEYYTTDSAVDLDGLELVINYDSTELTIDSIGSLIAASGSVVTATDVSTPASATYTITWTGAGDWTGGALPATLGVVNFTSAITLNEGDTSVVTLTATPNAGYAFHTAPITYTVGPAFTLDVDGDGSYNSLTDGILIFRYLAYTHLSYPTTWFSGAVNGDVRTTGPELAAYIQGGIDSGLLDIDGDGNFNSLTDGILVFRYLAYTHFSYPTTWFNGAVNGDVRNTGPELVNYLDALAPAP